MEDTYTTQISMRQLLEAGVHFGHQTKRWNPKMKPYIWGARNGIYIVDLRKTLRLYIEAIQRIEEVVSHGEIVLFVGTKRQAQEIIEEEAKRCRMPYVTNRWLGGTLTNFQTIRRSIEKINEIDELLSESKIDQLSKKDVLRFEKERIKLLRNLGGIRDMNKLPGFIFMIDPKKEHIAVREANRLKIPIFAVVDTNCDPEMIDHVIPGNDDAIKSIRLFASRVANACIVGMERHKEMVIKNYGKEGDAREGVMAVEGADKSVEVIVKKPRKQMTDQAQG